MSQNNRVSPVWHKILAIFALAAMGLSLGFYVAWDRYLDFLGPIRFDVAGRTSPIALDRHGRLLRAFTSADGMWRLPISLEHVDPRFIDMLMAYEDRRFPAHHGIDYRAMARAAVQLLQYRHVVSGGSTLTMQVARLLEPRDHRTWRAKLRQLVRATQIESKLTKTEILDLYLSLAPYGGNIEGVRAASLAYFGKEPKHLSVAEAALLVALPQSPRLRRPDRFPQAARAARDRVIDRAVERGVLTSEEAKAAKAEPVPSERHSFPMFAPHAAEEAVKRDRTRSVHHLTIDAALEGTLESLARESVLRLGPKLSAAIVVVDNATGEVLAHVGAADFFDPSRNGAIDMTQAVRSPGSALKPFIYALAFEQGIAHPETILEDRPTHYGTYAPEDFDRQFQGTVTARRALQMSLNVPAIALLSEVGPDRFLARLRSAGADIELPKGDAPAGLSVGLGGLGIRLADIVKLFSGMARGGTVLELVEDRDQRVVVGRHRDVTEPVAAWYVADILRGAAPPTNALAGKIAFKTGTSYGYRDAFAIGFDKRVTIGVWVGRADNASVPGLVGRQAAAPILFDAFARYGGRIETIPPPRNVLIAATADLPPPLRHLRKDAPKTIAAVATAELKIAYPPNGARIDLGLSKTAGQNDPDGPSALALKAEGGVLPLTWLVNGAPITAANIRREAEWKPDGTGFARVSVIDAQGATDSVTIRLE